MFKVIAIYVLLYLSVSACAQTIVTNPELDYVSSTKFPNDLVPNSDKVLRLDLDLYGDVKPTIFMSFQNFTDRSGNIWTAYTPVKGGYQRVDYTTEGDLIQFRADGFYSVGRNAEFPNQDGLYVLYSGKDGGQLVRYEIRNGTAHSQELRALNYKRQQDNDFVQAVLKHRLEQRDDFVQHHPIQTLSAATIRSKG